MRTRATIRSIRTATAGWRALSRIPRSRHACSAAASAWRCGWIIGWSLDELHRRIVDSHVFLAFLSPAYLESSWCAQEMDTFVHLVGQGSGADRVFLVEIRPTESMDWHAGVRDFSTDLSPIELGLVKGQESNASRGNTLTRL